jgi:hypothetical protein
MEKQNIAEEKPEIDSRRGVASERMRSRSRR